MTLSFFSAKKRRSKRARYHLKHKYEQYCHKITVVEDRTVAECLQGNYVPPSIVSFSPVGIVAANHDRLQNGRRIWESELEFENRLKWTRILNVSFLLFLVS